MSPVGPLRHIAPPRILGRKRGIAEIDRPTSIAEGDARDPKPTFAGPKFGREEMRNSISHLAECLDVPTTFGGDR
jgi:hypothetical protein